MDLILRKDKNIWFMLTNQQCTGQRHLYPTLCDRTNELSVLQEDLKILGEGQPPIEDVDLTGKHEGNQLYIWGAVVIVIGILLISIFRRRKKDGVKRS